MSKLTFGIIGLVTIWGLVIIMIPAMKKIAPHMKGYPTYAVVVGTLFTISTLIYIFCS